MISARRRILRAVLPVVAGGGLTVAGLGGPLLGSAPAADLPASNILSSTTPTTGSGSTEPGSGANGGESSLPSSTSTTEATPATSTTSAPAATATTTTAPAAGAPALSAIEAAPTVVRQHEQRESAGAEATGTHVSPTTRKRTTKAAKNRPSSDKSASTESASGANNVALSPTAVASEGMLAALLSSSEGSAQALGFYRIPPFLLPIYKAAAVQYGISWQILAAINEVETDYGTDLSVSSAGAVGWMQFLPSTWLQYGVDAVDAGYADPYNPVDAIFAAARYLRAAGAQTDLRGAILAYNHSAGYANSVLLRAKLISTYPEAVIATLTGLVDARLPVTGKQLTWSTPGSASAGAGTAKRKSSSATAEVSGSSTVDPSSNASSTGSSAALSPRAAAATSGASSPTSSEVEFDEWNTAPKASVIAVEDGRIVKIGYSRRLGKYLVLRDVYGDVFTYARLGSIAHTYSLAKSSREAATSTVVEAASTRAPAPTQPASAGTDGSATLDVKTRRRSSVFSSVLGQISPSPSSHDAVSGETGTPPRGRPDERDARATASRTSRTSGSARAGDRVPLHRGSVVASGTVLGRVSVTSGDQDGHLRFAIQPAGDSETIDPGAVLANWEQLQSALHPQGAKSSDALLGAGTSDVFLMAEDRLERMVLTDTDITMSACGRRQVADGAVDKRVLAVLEFLSRSGLAPTVSALGCETLDRVPVSRSGRQDAVDISAINGIPVAHHQGAGTITDLTIRALLTLPLRFLPHEILSLMRYPDASETLSEATYRNRIRLVFTPATTAAAATAVVAHSARSGRSAPAPTVVDTSALSSAQWDKLMIRVAALPIPKLAEEPSSAAVADPWRH